MPTGYLVYAINIFKCQRWTWAADGDLMAYLINDNGRDKHYETNHEKSALTGVILFAKCAVIK
ncbi:hypothetical protein TCT1_26410 [Xenorhabdus sp. TCT-1]|uniref:Transposase n=1 Tax=Xenorhabdus taiwanensis TaxID=3085177 RepID=A0ABM8JYE1_9GAMM|nr:hypothetical protein TCT1_26410 [Xenorhabdus sp. TCT-1]